MSSTSHTYNVLIQSYSCFRSSDYFKLMDTNLSFGNNGGRNVLQVFTCFLRFNSTNKNIQTNSKRTFPNNFRGFPPRNSPDFPGFEAMTQTDLGANFTSHDEACGHDDASALRKDFRWSDVFFCLGRGEHVFFFSSLG